MPKVKAPKKAPDAPEPAPVESLASPASSLPFSEVAPRADRPTAGKRMAFTVSPEGGIDWSAMRESNKENFERVLRADPRVIALVNPDVAAAGLITPTHVEGLLDVVGVVERMAIPPIAKAKWGIEFHPAVVDKCFRFTEQQKKDIGPPGAAVANEYLPEAVQGWIVKTDNVGKLVLLLGEAVQSQVKSAMAMQMALENQKRDEVKVTSNPAGEGEVLTN